MAYSELFKNYSDIRNFMRRFYVYGFEKRQDFTAKSSRSYDDNRRRLDSWLEDYMSFKSEADGRAYRISFDSSSISHNPLYKTWKAFLSAGYSCRRQGVFGGRAVGAAVQPLF